jgi:hypothetical protein
MYDNSCIAFVFGMLHETRLFLHSKGNGHQFEKEAHRMGEKLY